MFTRERLTRWTQALRANPEQQMRGCLANGTYTQFCCLGKLYEVEGVARDIGDSHRDMGGYIIEPKYGAEYATLEGQLATDFGSSGGCFSDHLMPDLVYGGVSYNSAIAANDRLVPWPIIADHFDKHYPCSDELKG